MLSCVFDIANQLLTPHLSFPFRFLVILMNELPRLHHSQSNHLLMLPNYDCKNIENFVSRTDNDVHNFLEGGTNKIRKKKEVLAVESDNRGLEDLPQAYLTGCSKRFLLSVRK